MGESRPCSPKLEKMAAIELAGVEVGGGGWGRGRRRPPQDVVGSHRSSVAAASVAELRRDPTASRATRDGGRRWRAGEVQSGMGKKSCVGCGEEVGRGRRTQGKDLRPDVQALAASLYFLVKT